MLANADRDANTILAAMVTRSIAHQKATLAHPSDEGFALFAEVEEHKIRAAWPKMKAPGGKFTLELASAVNCLGYVSPNELLIGRLGNPRQFGAILSPQNSK